MFTYQGRVLDNGTNFTGMGQFKFALVTSTNTSRQATATAFVNSGFVTGYNVTDGGSGYPSPPAVTVSGGGGSGATATASASGGAVTGIAANNPGSGYTSTPLVTIAAPPSTLSYTTYWSNDGTSVAGSEPSAAVSLSVANGLFTVVLGDTTLANMMTISASLFTQPNLQVRIWFNDGVSGFAALNPVQNLTPTPYAIFAGSASNLSGTLGPAQLSGNYSGAVTLNNTANNLTGTFTGNGGGLTNVNAATLGGFGADQLWKTAGNNNTIAGVNFLGTPDNQPLDFRVNNGRALQLAPTTNTANFIGGDSHNFVAPGVYGATIGGGGTLAYPGGSGLTNKILAHFATIGGGVGNTASGTSNRQDGDSATVGGGWRNSALGNNATVAGGVQNQALGDNSAIGGGAYNTIQTNVFQGTISGGHQNTIQTNANYATISGGYIHTIWGGANYATIAGGGSNAIQADARSSTISGGFQNTIESGAIRAAIGGGIAQLIRTNAHHSTISGVEGNAIQTNSDHSTIGGGYSNSITGSYGNIPGGDQNVAGTNSFAAGHRAKALHTGSFIWGDSQDADFASTAANQFLIRASGGTGIGTDSPQAPLHVRGAYGSQLVLQDNVIGHSWSINNDNNDNLVFVPNTGTGGYIYRGNGNYFSLSDLRLKQDVSPLGGVLDRVLQLRPVSYLFRGAAEGTPRTLGLIAQEVEPLFPEVVGELAGTKSLAYSELVPVTIRAIQELDRKVNSENAELREELKRRDAESAELNQNMKELRQLVNKLAAERNGGAR